MPTLKQVRQLLKIHTSPAVHDQLERATTVRELDLVLRTAKMLEPCGPPAGGATLDSINARLCDLARTLTAEMKAYTDRPAVARVGERPTFPMSPPALEDVPPVGRPPSTADLPPGTTAANLVLQKVGTNKIGVIKAIRACTDLGLKEAKDVADRVDTVGPQVVLHDVPVTAASRVASELSNLGAITALTVP